MKGVLRVSRVSDSGSDSVSLLDMMVGERVAT